VWIQCVWIVCVWFGIVSSESLLWTWPTEWLLLMKRRGNIW